MNNKLTILSVIIAHLCVITGLVFVGGCRSSTGMEGEPNRRAFSGFPGESGASGYEASYNSTNRSVSASQPAPVVNPPSAVTVNEPAPVPVADNNIPAAVTVNEPAPVPVSEPAPVANVAPVGAGRTYTVKKNESLWIIAKREGISVDDIIAANHLNKNAVLREGQKVTIPAGSGRKVSASSRAAKSDAVAVSGESYVVKSGDSISTIARKLGTTSSALREANGLKGDSIRIGQKLSVPAGAKNKSGTVASSSKKQTAAPAAVAADAKAPSTADAKAPAAVPASSSSLRDVPLMGGGIAPAPVSAEPAPAPEAVEATPVSK